MGRGLLLLLLFFGISCSYDPVSSRLKNANQIAFSNSLQKSLVKTDDFFIMTYQKITSDKQPLNVYIEGDGFAWAAPGRLSVNPTPRNPVALKLASVDESQNVAYLARPCQYIDFDQDALCESKYWHKSKYSKKVVKSISQAIDSIKRDNDIKAVNLIGFSGGGGIAAILGALRDDVVSIRSVAGNLDHVSFNNYHKVDQLDDSLNAADFTDGLKNIPQLYISGTNDKVVPSFIAENFVKKIDSKNGCANVHTLKGVNHHDGWERHWNKLITKPLECIGKNES